MMSFTAAAVRATTAAACYVGRHQIVALFGNTQIHLHVLPWRSTTTTPLLLDERLLFLPYIGAAWIEQEELRISRYAQSRLTANRWITLLGRTGGWVGPEGEAGMHHLPIFSFLIQRGSRFLHHNFVCALLNDLFGIQSRGKEVTQAFEPFYSSHACHGHGLLSSIIFNL